MTPDLAVISFAKSLGSPFVPFSPGVTASVISLAVNSSPSNTTFEVGVEPTTFTGTSTFTEISSITFPVALSLYLTVTVTGVCWPFLSVFGVTIASSVTNGVTPSGTFFNPVIALLTSARIASINFSFDVPFKTVTPFGAGFGRTLTVTSTGSSRLNWSAPYVTVTGTLISWPDFPSVEILLTSGFVTLPSLPGVTAPPTFSADGLSPSTTYTVFAVDTRGWTLIVNSWVMLSSLSFLVSNTGSLSNGLSTISYPIDFKTSIWVCTSLSEMVSPDFPVRVKAWSVNSVSVWVFGSTETNLTFAFWSSLS